MIFKFPAAGIRLVRVIFITMFYLVVLIVVYEHDPKDAWKVIVALLVVAPFMLAACYATFDIGLDLLIDDVGVFRILDGRKFKHLEWSEIEAIKDVVMAGAYGRRRRFFHVLPKSAKRGRFWGSGKIVFSDEMDNFPAFVRVMNEKLRVHAVSVQCLKDGQLRSCNEISI
ncbi:MAG TPA: hypothetical protein VJP80_03610 [Candidatus Saccharimonadales bacterium]|nr:hypothetical protein [Candidatus Saccharimonadales bacterium]